jgi:hypothetical protein
MLTVPSVSYMDFSDLTIFCQEWGAECRAREMPGTGTIPGNSNLGRVNKYHELGR